MYFILYDNGSTTTSSVRLTCFCADLEIKRVVEGLLPWQLLTPAPATGKRSKISAKAAEPSGLVLDFRVVSQLH